jgi:hypothetical protein
VVIKLADAKPEQLGLGVVEASNSVLKAKTRSNLLVTRACIRSGCVLLVFDLMAASSTHEGAASAPITPASTAGQRSLSGMLSDSSCGCGQQCSGDTPPHHRQQQQQQQLAISAEAPIAGQGLPSNPPNEAEFDGLLDTDKLQVGQQEKGGVRLPLAC